MNDRSLRIGVVGTGRMGANIARRLHDVGYRIAVVYDSRRQAAADIADEVGAEAAASLARVAELSDVVLTVVSDDAAMDRIFARRGDSLLDGAAGKIFVNCATVTPSVHVDVQSRAEAAGAQSLEACMASSIPQARDGTLYLMVGGRLDAFERVKAVLTDMSASLTYVGEAGRAAQLKALVNMVMNANTAALAEGLGLADALGLDLDAVRDAFAHTGADSRVLHTDGADMQQREHDVYFSAEHAAKDSGIALALAADAGVAVPVAQATYDQFERMKTMGLGDLDKSGVSELTFLSRHGKDTGTMPDSKQIPFISSQTTGPLGVAHLPRLWTKLTLGYAGRLADGWDHCGSGFDQLTIDDLGLDRDKVMEFVRTQKPTYVQFEDYVVANGKTDPETIRKHNETISGYNHPPEKAKNMRDAMGIKNEQVADAVTLNSLDDLHELHHSLS